MVQIWGLQRDDLLALCYVWHIRIDVYDIRSRMRSHRRLFLRDQGELQGYLAHRRSHRPRMTAGGYRDSALEQGLGGSKPSSTDPVR